MDSTVDKNILHNDVHHNHLISKPWNIQPSEKSKRTLNPIRRVMDRWTIQPNPKLKVISLSIGDPTIFANLLPHENMLDAVEKSLRSNKHNGYASASGEFEARKAIAELMTLPSAPLTPEDILITSGCSGALEICFGTIANPGDNILIPKPGFSLYKTIGCSDGLDTRYYRLLPDREWEVDIEHLESLIDERTKCIVVNNPSNPCGSVYSKEHLIDILKVAERNRLLVLADEIYAYTVFAGETYYPMASLTKTVPVLSCCAISKRFLVPGWRLGWIEIHDRDNLLSEMRPRLADMCTRIVGANAVIQGALPKMLKETPRQWFEQNMAFVQENAESSFKSLAKIDGLNPIKPRGAIFMMVGIDQKTFPTTKDDNQFAQKLLATKSVFVLPGTCFAYTWYFRIVLTVPKEQLIEACGRIKEFCDELRLTK